MIHCHSYPTNEDVVDLNRGIGYLIIVQSKLISRTLLIIMQSTRPALLVGFFLFGTPYA